MHGFYCLNVGEANAMEIKIKRIIIIKESEKIKKLFKQPMGDNGRRKLKTN